MKVAVTGATGHIGGNLVRVLLASGHTVRAIHRSDTRPLDGLGVEAVRADVRDPVAMVRALDGMELVFHLAGRITINGDPDGEVLSTNRQGTASVAAACLNVGVRRLVHFSSIHALRQDPHDQPLDEARPLADEGVGHCLTYDRTKAAGEREIRAAVERGLDAVIVNPTSVIGPIDFKPSAMGAACLKIARRQLPALVDAGFDWVDVRDVAQGAVSAGLSGRKGERYLLSGAWTSFGELAGQIARAAGVRPPRFVAPLWMAALGAPFSMAWAKLSRTRPLVTLESLETLRTSHRAISHGKAAQELGYRPRPLEETTGEIVRWFRDAGFLKRGGRA